MKEDFYKESLRKIIWKSKILFTAL
jgi:hypothetical protein